MKGNGQLLLIRHAETDAAGSFCGHSDPPVNSSGVAQIDGLVSSLGKHAIEVVYSSDLQRATTTAEAIATALSVPVRVTPRLREIYFGDWEGCTWKQIERRDPEYAQRWIDDFPKLATPNGEHFDVFEDRVLREFDLIAALEQTAAIVTHAGCLRVMLTRRCGLSDKEAWAETATYCSVQVWPSGGSRRHGN